MARFLSCGCCPETLFGKDIDEVFAYQTPRIVIIKDRTLGLAKNLLMLLIFFYIFIYSVLYQGAHFEKSPVEGVVRVQWQEPTKGWCNPLDADCTANFRAIDSLPYCKGYTGSKPSQVVRSCEFYDARELPITLPQGVLIPTFLSTFKQIRKCEPGSRKCDLKWQYVDADDRPQDQRGPAHPATNNFVADVNDFTLMIDHSFRTANGKVSYDDYSMQGYWSMCSREEEEPSDDCETVPIKCVHGDCDELGLHSAAFLEKSNFSHGASRRAAGARVKSRARDLELGFLSTEEGWQESRGPSNTEDAAAEANEADGRKPTVISIKDGDVLSLDTILAMAGTSLGKVLDEKDDQGEPVSVRSRGTSVVVNIVYENKQPWRLLTQRMPPRYTITVSPRPVDTFKHTYVTEERLGPSGNMERHLTTAYGVYIIIKQSGTIRTFSTVHFLMTMTSAMALLAVSNMATDMLALYVLPKKDTYKQLKYKESEDLGGPHEKTNEEES